MVLGFCKVWLIPIAIVVHDELLTIIYLYNPSSQLIPIRRNNSMEGIIICYESCYVYLSTIIAIHISKSTLWTLNTKHQSETP